MIRTRLIKSEIGYMWWVLALSNRTARDVKEKPYQIGKKNETIRNKPHQDRKRPGAISTNLIEPNHQRWEGLALSNRKEAKNDREHALSRRKEAMSDKYKPYQNGPPDMTRTSPINRKGARNDKEQALSRRKAARSDKYKPCRNRQLETIRTSIIKQVRSQKW